MNLNLEYYKIFYYIGKYKNITLAAEKAVFVSAGSKPVHP